MINAYAALEAKARLTAWQYEPGPLGRHEVEIAVFATRICR